ncbi:hypothetical protein D3C72_2181280 [compost metagenome]
MRYTIKASKLVAMAVPQAEITKVSAAIANGNLRPKRSDSRPEIRAPKIQPTSAELIAQPDCAGSVMPK